MVTTSPVRETREDAMVRLASKAREDGIKLYRDPKDGRHYASSRSQPGRFHYVTALSCTCAGFVSHQRCSHLAALHAALGWITTTPKPTPPTPAVCSDCGGHGEVQDLEVRQHGRFVMQWATCTRCSGTGTGTGTDVAA